MLGVVDDCPRRAARNQEALVGDRPIREDLGSHRVAARLGHRRQGCAREAQHREASWRRVHDGGRNVDVHEGGVVKRAVGAHVGRVSAGGTGSLREFAPLLAQLLDEGGVRDIEPPPAEPLPVDVRDLRADRHALRHRGLADDPHARPVPGVPAAGDVGAGDQGEQREVVGEAGVSRALADVAGEVHRPCGHVINPTLVTRPDMGLRRCGRWVRLCLSPPRSASARGQGPVVGVAQLVERRVVVADVAGSSPVTHPTLCWFRGLAGHPGPRRSALRIGRFGQRRAGRHTPKSRPTPPSTFVVCENHTMDTTELGRRIARAREDSGMTQEGLGRAVGLDRSAISRLEKGERKINVPELVEIAASLGRPLTYFVVEALPAVVSRRNDQAAAQATTHLLDVELGMFASDVRDVAAMGVLAPEAERINLRVPRNHGEAERSATEVRRYLGLDSQPVADVGRECERLGLFTFSCPLGVNGPDGGFVEVQGSLGAAVINGDSPPGRRRMTLAHELGHHIFGDAYDAESSRDSERMINSFAIHLLAPRSGVRKLWDENGTWVTRDRALAVGATFRLSWSASVNQLANLDLISVDERMRLSQIQPRHGDYARLGLRWADELSPPYLSPRFTSDTLNAYVEGRLTRARTLEILRETLTEQDLPEQSPPTLDDLRAAFAGHDG